MTEAVAGLLAALVGLCHCQFLFIFLGVTASVMYRHHCLAQQPRADLNLEVIFTIIWLVFRSFVPNAIVEWYSSRNTCKTSYEKAYPFIDGLYLFLASSYMEKDS